MLEESVLSLNMQRPRTSQAAAEATSGKPAAAVTEGRGREQERSVSAAAGIGIGVVADLPNPNLAASMSGSFSALLQEFAGLDLAPTPATAKAAARPEAAVSVPAPAPASASALRAGRSDSFLVHVLRLGERPVPPDNLSLSDHIYGCVLLSVCVARPAVDLGRRQLRGAVRPAAAGLRRQGRSLAAGPGADEDHHRCRAVWCAWLYIH